MSAYDSETLSMMQHVYDAVLSQLSEPGDMPDQNLREAIAKVILFKAGTGEADPKKIEQYAILKACSSMPLQFPRPYRQIYTVAGGNTEDAA